MGRRVVLQLDARVSEAIDATDVHSMLVDDLRPCIPRLRPLAEKGMAVGVAIGEMGLARAQAVNRRESFYRRSIVLLLEAVLSAAIRASISSIGLSSFIQVIQRNAI